MRLLRSIHSCIHVFNGRPIYSVFLFHSINIILLNYAHNSSSSRFMEILADHKIYRWTGGCGVYPYMLTTSHIASHPYSMVQCERRRIVSGRRLIYYHLFKSPHKILKCVNACGRCTRTHTIHGSRRMR